MSNPTLSYSPGRGRAGNGRSAALRMLAGLGGWLRAVARWRRLRRDEAFLLSQPDYILRDIGIGRSEIETIVRGRGRR